MVVVMIMVVVMMVVVVAVERQCPLGARAKQGAIFGGICHHMRRAFAADMPVQAQDTV